MTYDGLDRLKTVVSPMYGTTGATYTYDVLDNLTRVTIGGTSARDHHYCYDASWRLTNLKTGSCTGTTVIGLGYDVQGNLQNKNGRTYEFDFGNRLRSVAADPATGAPASTYVYDAHGRRVRDTTTAAVESHYLHNGQLSLTSDHRRKKVAEYIHLAGSLIAIRERDVPTAVYTIKYQHTDALGSPVVVTDQNRTVLERSEYEPYGNVLSPANPIDGPGYTGHVYDSATGLNYMQQRYYDPLIGRFLSRDPVTANAITGANFNAYWYANNNPYRFTDPDGRQSKPRRRETGSLHNHSSNRGGVGIAGNANESWRAAGGSDSTGTIDSFDDLPALPEGVYTDGDGIGNFSGEGWERVERWTGKQEVRWNQVSDDAWAEVPLVNFHRYPARSAGLLGVVIEAALPDLRHARQSGFWGMEYQIGYQHVFQRMENGAALPSVPVQTGYGIIWTNQTYWKIDASQPFLRTRFTVGW